MDFEVARRTLPSTVHRYSVRVVPAASVKVSTTRAPSHPSDSCARRCGRPGEAARSGEGAASRSTPTADRASRPSPPRRRRSSRPEPGTSPVARRRRPWRWLAPRRSAPASMSTPTPRAPNFCAAAMTMRPSPHPRSYTTSCGPTVRASVSMRSTTSGGVGDEGRQARGWPAGIGRPATAASRQQPRRAWDLSGATRHRELGSRQVSSRRAGLQRYDWSE